MKQPCCIVVLVLGLVTCGRKEQGSSTVAVGSSNAGSSGAAAAPIAVDKLRALLDAQVAALPDNGAALLSTFGKDAIALTPQVVTATPSYTDIGHDIVAMNPRSQFVSAKVTSFHAGGSTQLAWFAAELEIVTSSHDPGEKPGNIVNAIRTVQLVDPAQNKVVAASFGRVKPMERRGDTPKVEAPTDAGPLAALLTKPDTLATTFSADTNAAVFGTDPDERGFGADAKTLVGKWSALVLAIEPGRVHEVRTAGYGYVAADVNLTSGAGKPYRLTALLVAMPGANGGWTPVALHFIAL